MDFLSHLFANELNPKNIGFLIYLFAFLGGVVTSVSPCSLGLLPVIVSFVIGTEKQSTKSIIQILFFILGLSLMLTSLGVFCALTGKIFGSHSGSYFTLIMASLIMIFGLHLMDIIEIPMPVFVKQLPKNTNNDLILYPMMIGALFAFANTPCSTPILAGILAYTSVKANIISGAMLLFLFSLGQGSILVIAGLFTSLFKKMLKLNQYSQILLKISGAILVLVSLMIFVKIFSSVV